MKKSLLGMLLLGQLSQVASAEPAPEWAQDAVDTLQQQGIVRGYPDGSLKGDRPTSRDELAELIERLDQERLKGEAGLAPRTDLDGLRQETQGALDELETLETRVDNLEQGTEQLQQRRDEVRRPGI